MKNEKRDKLLKRFYGIRGVVDEYKRGQADRIGNNAFMFLFYYLLVANLVGFMVAIKQPIYALYGLLGANLLVLLWVICPYLIWASKKSFITAEEMTPEEAAEAKKSSRLEAVWRAVYFGVMMILTMGGFHWLGGGSFLEFVTKPRNIIIYACAGLFFGVSTTLFANSQIKKVREEDE